MIHGTQWLGGKRALKGTRKTVSSDKRGDARNRTARVHQRASRVRDRILQGARNAFLAHGYELATMDMIAKHAGVARASLYYQFRDKEELFTSLMRENVHRWAYRATEAATPGPDAVAKLRQVAVRFLQHACHPETLRFYRVVVAESERFPWLAQLFYENGPKFVAERFAAALRDIDRSKGLTASETAARADQLLAILMGGLYLRRVLDVPDPVIDRSLETFVDRAIALLKR
jgi:TetR/AcrR family transcriptional regulator, mexJK operon transcriptional repressor